MENVRGSCLPSQKIAAMDCVPTLDAMTLCLYNPPQVSVSMGRHCVGEFAVSRADTQR